MRPLDDFQSQLQARVMAAARTPHWAVADIEEYMSAFRARQEGFDKAARTLIQQVVQPRLDRLSQLFSSSRITTHEGTNRCSCWFAACDRYPVTAKIEFVIEHDASFEQLYVRCEVYLTPVFFQFQPHDKLSIMLDQVDETLVGDWVEERIFEFLATYLLHDRGLAEDEEDALTDPVCGMRLRRPDVSQQFDYRGHTYHFCSPECRDRFERKPLAFIAFRTE